MAKIIVTIMVMVVGMPWSSPMKWPSWSWSYQNSIFGVLLSFARGQEDKRPGKKNVILLFSGNFEMVERTLSFSRGLICKFAKGEKPTPYQELNWIVLGWGHLSFSFISVPRPKKRKSLVSCIAGICSCYIVKPFVKQKLFILSSTCTVIPHHQGL